MPTLPDYPGVSRIWHWFPALPYRSPDLLDQIDFWAFLCFSLNLAHFFPKNLYFFISQFLGHFCTYLVTDKVYFVITMMKMNFDSMLFIWCPWRQDKFVAGVERGGLLIFGGRERGAAVQNGESPDFRSPEVNISEHFTCLSKVTSKPDVLSC